MRTSIEVGGKIAHPPHSLAGPLIPTVSSRRQATIGAKDDQCITMLLVRPKYVGPGAPQEVLSQAILLLNFVARLAWNIRHRSITSQPLPRGAVLRFVDEGADFYVGHFSWLPAHPVCKKTVCFEEGFES